MGHRSAYCLNCGEPTPGAFCAACGQRNSDHRESLREFAGDLVGELLQLDSRLGHTLVPFLFSPGTLTREYNAGRRTRYSSPVRMFLLLSVAYFFALSLVGARARWHLQFHHDRGGTQFSLGGSDDEDGGVAPAVDGGSGDGGDAERDPDETPAGDGGEPPGAVARLLDRRSASWNQLSQDEATRRIVDGMAANASKAVFLLLPVFALLLQAFFRGLYYLEHLVFAIHYHSLVFFLLLLELLVPAAAAWLAAAALGHLWVALRTVYRQSWGRTAWKLALLLCVYLVVLVVAVGGVVLATILFG